MSRTLIGMYTEPSQITDKPLQPRTLEEYRKAIADLEASTLAIESHILTTQHILDTISARRDNKTRPTANTKHQALSAQISSQHTSLTQYLTASSADLQKAVSSTLITIDDTLSRDDYTFDQIAQSLSAIDLNGPEAEHDGNDTDVENGGGPSRTSRLLDALHRTETEVIRTRLERVYLDTLKSSSHTSASNGTGSIDNDHGYDYHHADPTKTSAIQSDLRTLYTEIEDVTSLFIAHEHGDILSQLEGEISRVKQVLSQQRGELAVSQIKEMRGRLLGLEESVRGVRGQRVVVERLGTLLGAIDEASGKVDGNVLPLVGVGKSEGDGPALTGLRGYLGVGVGGIGQGERVDESFKEVKCGVERALNVQKGQTDMLRRNNQVSQKETDGKNQKPGEVEIEMSRDVYTAMLDELDREIAVVKEGIEKLPPG